jgi:periplasmic copper chaperone A
MIRVFCFLVALIGFAVSAWAGDIVVSRAIVVAPPNAKAATIAAYFTLENHGTVADQLIGISTASAASAMLHETTNTDGVMKMTMLEKLDVAAGATVEMKPAQLHVMLVGPKSPYKIGDAVAFELVFAEAGELQVVAKVVPLSQALSPQ